MDALVGLVAVAILMALVFWPVFWILGVADRAAKAPAPSGGANLDDYLGGTGHRSGSDAHPYNHDSFDTYEMFDDASDGGGD